MEINQRRSDGRVVVLVASPPMTTMDGIVDRLMALDPRIAVTCCGYSDDLEVRAAKESPSATVDELRRLDVPLSAEQVDAFAAAEVILALDAPMDLPRHAPRLRWIHGFGSGVGQLRQVGLLGSEIMLTNSRGVASVPIAEFVLARVLSVWKRLPELDALQARQVWKPTFGRRLDRLTMAIVGMGEIGSALAQRAKAFDMRVLGIRRSYRPGMTMANVDVLGGPDDLERMLREADIVVLAAPATPETEGMINRRTLAAMRQGAVLCNVARGTLIDDDALIGSLRAGHLGAAILDVTREEPLPPTSPLWDAPNTYLSAHCAVALDSYRDDVLALFTDNLGRYLRNEALRNVVDVSKL